MGLVINVWYIFIYLMMKNHISLIEIYSNYVSLERTIKKKQNEKKSLVCGWEMSKIEGKKGCLMTAMICSKLNRSFSSIDKAENHHHIDSISYK